MKTLRTPDDRFTNLPDFPYEPNYLQIPDGEGGELRIHYVDEGPPSADPVLLMHGEPSWSFLYRYMIPILVDAGHRIIAPDLPGFGRSDKPADRNDYTYKRHVDWMHSVLDSLKLNNITLVCQDWGGLIGLRLVGENPDIFARVVVGNSGLPTGDGSPSEAFLNWQKFSQEVPVLNIRDLFKMGLKTKHPDEVYDAYDAPFPDDSYKEGARIFPALVPTGRDDPARSDNLRAWETLRKFAKPFLTAFSDSDPVTAGGDKFLQETIPGAKGQPHTIIKNAGHFLQDDAGEEFAKVIVDFIAATPL